MRLAIADGARRKPKARSPSSAAPGTCRRCAAKCRQGRPRAAKGLAEDQGDGDLGAVDRDRASPPASGYGAGVVSPGWYAHLWGEIAAATAPQLDASARVLPPTHFTVALAGPRRGTAAPERAGPTSTASVIEAARLAVSLAALRDLALPGPRRDARGEPRDAVRRRDGAVPADRSSSSSSAQRVGEIDDAVPQMPLAADLARWQTQAQAEARGARQRHLARSAQRGGPRQVAAAASPAAARRALGHADRSGLQPRHVPRELAAALGAGVLGALAEALVYGTTVEQAAGNAAIAAAAQGRRRSTRSPTSCAAASMPASSRPPTRPSRMLQTQAPRTSDIGALAGAVPPLAEILRYGTAREIPSGRAAPAGDEPGGSGLRRPRLRAAAACRPRQRASCARSLPRSMSPWACIEDDGLDRSWRRALGKVADDNAAPSAARRLCAAHALRSGRARRRGNRAASLSRAVARRAAARRWRLARRLPRHQRPDPAARSRRCAPSSMHGWSRSAKRTSPTCCRCCAAAFPASTGASAAGCSTRSPRCRCHRWAAASVALPPARPGQPRARTDAPGFAAALPLLLTSSARRRLVGTPSA